MKDQDLAYILDVASDALRKISEYLKESTDPDAGITPFSEVAKEILGDTPETEKILSRRREPSFAPTPDPIENPPVSDTPDPPVVAQDPPAPVQTAPISTPAEPIAPSTQDSGVELDVDGYPWDERIHSRGKTKMKNGNWRQRRECDSALVKRIKQEWDNRNQTHVPDGNITPDPPVVDSTPSAAPAAPAAPAAQAWTFPELMTAVQKSGKITSEQLNAAVRASGAYDLKAVAADPTYIPAIVGALEL
jgi:hypothetical protein